MSSNVSLTAADAVSTLISDFNKAAERLTSGMIINSAKDGSAALAVREMLRSNIAAGMQASRNISDGISMVQTAHSAAASVNTDLRKMKELAVKAANGTYSDSQKQITQDEFMELAANIDQTTAQTTFNGIKLIGADAKETTIAIGNGQTITLNSDTFNIDLSSVDLVSDAKGAFVEIEAAIARVSEYQASLGTSNSRLESSLSVTEIQTENLIASESRISNVNIAMEITSMLAAKIALQASVAFQVHSNTMLETTGKLIN